MARVEVLAVRLAVCQESACVLCTVVVNSDANGGPDNGSDGGVEGVVSVLVEFRGGWTRPVGLVVFAEFVGFGHFESRGEDVESKEKNWRVQSWELGMC